MALRDRDFLKIWLCISLLLVSSTSLSATRSGSPRSQSRCNEELGEPLPQRLPKIEPIILKPLQRLVDDPNLQYEMKYDGFRAIGYFEPDRCRFVSKQGKTLTQFKSLCEAVAKELNVKNAIFDGEVIAVDPAGRPIFNKMLRREGPFQYVAFDLLWLNGEDLRGLPLKIRRKRLVELLPKSSRLITESLVQVGSGTKLFELMVKNDLEGIVVKRLSDKYSRSTKWYKFKNKNYSQAIGRSRFFR